MKELKINSNKYIFNDFIFKNINSKTEKTTVLCALLGFKVEQNINL